MNGLVARCLLSLFLLFHFLSDVPAQNYLPVAHYFGVEDGLPHRQVHCILQDRQGFIWVATEGGVARFDGLRFKIFNKADNGLSTDRIHWMLEDAAGKLWLISGTVGTENFWSITSVDILNPVSGQVMPLEQYIRGKPPVPFKNIHVLGISPATEGPDQPGTLFFGTRNPGGWVSWHPDQGWDRVMAPSISGLEILTRTPQNGVLGLLNGHSYDQLFVELDASGNAIRYMQGAPGNKFYRLSGYTKKLEKYFAIEEGKGSSRPVYWEIKAGADKTRLALPLPNRRVSSPQSRVLLEIEPGKLWLTEQEVFNQKGETQLDLLARFPAINNNFISTSFRDRNGGIWIGTSFGLELIEVRKDHFRRFLYSEHARDGGGYSCRGIWQDGNNLWVNIDRFNTGLHGIDLETGRVFYAENNSSNYGLATDAAGNRWSGKDAAIAKQGVLTRIDPVSGKLLNSYDFGPTAIWSIFPAKSDQLWCGTNRGLVFFNTKTEQVLTPDTRNFPELATADIIYIGRDRKGAAWLCSTTGFYLMTDEGQIAARFWNGGKGDNWLPFDNFYHFYQDAEGVFWLGTSGGGLLRWDTKTGEKRLLSRKNGLLNNFVYAVYEDDFGHLWLPTDLGIAQFDKASLSVRRIWGLEDGITHNEFNRTSHYQGADGTLYFGGLNGVTAFHPKDFYGGAPETRSENAQTAPGPQEMNAGKILVLCDFKLFSGSSDKLENRTAALLASGKITMQPDDRYFQLEFALLDYFSPKKAIYAYMMEGIDEDWNILSEPLLRLSGLPYGAHRLKIRAQSADGIWAKNELEYQLLVLPPVYLRWWFLLLVAGALLCGGFYFYRFQLNRRLAQKEAQRLQQLDAFKTRFFTNISHEFRTPLTVILGMAESLKNDTGSKRELSAEMILRNSRQLLNLVNQLLDLSRVESGKLQLSPSNGDLASFLQYQLESFHSYAQTRGISLVFNSRLAHLPMAFDHEKIQTILANLVSNALKFTPEGGQIALDLHTDPPDNGQHPAQVMFELSDTGAGIPEDQLDRIFDRFYQVDDSLPRKGEGTGIGLALVQELVKLMQGNITVGSEPGKGTVFRVALPFTPPLAQLQSYAGADNLKQGFPIPVAPEPEEALADEDRRPLLLIVEDNPDVRFYIAKCVRNEYRVALADNGAEGIRQARDLVPDIVISDVMMPEKDGFELCETLKSEEATSHIPVVLLTARADFESRIAGLKRGADDYLAKPFEPAELLARLENLVKLRRLLQQRYAGMPALPTSGDDPALAQEDAFLLRFREAVEARLSDPEFDIPQLERALGMSRSQIFRKVKALTGRSPSIFIRNLRLHKAKELLLNSELAISEIAYEVGFSTPAYFSTTFLDAFGKTPGEFRKNQ